MSEDFKEIERKFLVRDATFREEAFKTERIAQGFLSSVPERTVRVRLSGGRGFLTVKGIGNRSGARRFEWEKEITSDEAVTLLELCEPGRVEKTRFFVRADEHVFEVDVFEGENKGLIVAEIELKEESEPFKRPSWLGDEVTGQVKYYNAALARHPYSQW